MSNFRKAVENTCRAITALTYQYALWVVILMFAAIGAIGYQIKDLQADLSTEGSLHKSDPVRLDYMKFKDLFGRDDMIIVGLETGGELSPDALQQLQVLHETIERDTPNIEEVTSLINARYVYGDDTSLYVEDLWSGKRADTWSEKALEEFVVNHPNYRNTLIASDGSLVTVLIKLSGYKAQEDDGNPAPLTEEDDAEILASIHKTLADFKGRTTYLSGNPVIESELLRITNDDVILGTGLCTIVMMAILAVFFRRLSGVFLPFLIVQCAVISALGVMSITGAPFTIITNVMIVMMLVIGICDAVHVMSFFYRRFEQSGDKREAIIYAVGHSGPALILTSLTTAAGFLSFAYADLSSIADLGIYAAVEVMFALFYTLTLLPALVAIFPINGKTKGKRTSLWIDRALKGAAQLSINYPAKVAFVTLLIIIAMIPGIMKLEFSQDVISFFPESSPVRLDQQVLDERLDGVGSLEIMIDTGQVDGVKKVEFLNDLQLAINDIENKDIAGIQVGNAFSILDILKETNRALNENNSSHYTIPNNQPLIAQELLLFESGGGEDLEKVSDSEFRIARVTIKTPYVDDVLYEHLLQEVRESVKTSLGQYPKVSVTGKFALGADSIPRALRSMTSSYLSAAIVITLLVMLMAGNWKLGLLAMIPNFLPIMVSLGVMGYFSVPLDTTSIMIGAIALGVVVDDTLHFIYNYTNYYNRKKDSAAAVEQTLSEVGRAMLMTTAIVSFGFAVDIAATLSNVQAFGLIISLTVLMALVADLIVAPSLMVLASWRNEQIADSAQDIANTA